MTEFNLFPDVELLEDSIYEKYHGDYTLTWLSSTPFNLESYIAIQEGLDALGDNHDCLYVYSNDFEFGEDDIVIAYGVDHSQTGQAVYNNVIIYGKEYFDGFGGITNTAMAKSARQYISDTVVADKLFAYSFSRHPIPDNPYVFLVPADTANNLSGINVGDAALMCNRLYVNSVTKIGPDPLEVIIDRFILLRPRSSGLFEMDIATPSLKVYPNPVTSQATIEVMVPEWSDVEIALFTSTGQQIDKTIPFGHVRGMVRQDINFGNSHSPGIYYLQVIVHERGSHKERYMMSKVVLL
jgi:hypothetical protein